MSHKPNLIPGSHKLTPEENAKGGVNGAKTRKERKQIIELARNILDMPLNNDDIADAEDLPSLNDIESANVDVKTKIIATLATKALNGNIKATQTLFTLTGDYSTKQESRIMVDNDLANLDKAKYSISIKNETVEYKLTYFDNAGNICKVLYGDEAKRLGELKEEWTEDFQIIVHSADDEEDRSSLIIPDLPMTK